MKRAHYYNLRHMVRVYQQGEDPYYTNRTPDLEAVIKTVGVYRDRPRNTLLEEWDWIKNRFGTNGSKNHPPASPEKRAEFIRYYMKRNWRAN